MQGFLRKMSSRHNDPIDYYLRLDEKEIHLNPYIGSYIRLSHSGKIACLNCERVTRKSYSQGYCYPCFRKLAQCDLCVLSPERCHFDKGTCRDHDFAENFCMQAHIVYIANSSGIKVGITKEENLPGRWIDQGAVQALPIIKVQTRQQSGFVEVAFKKHISDRTQWRRMLQSGEVHLDLIESRDRLLQDVSPDLDALRKRFGLAAIQLIPGAAVQTFHYPVQHYPSRVVSMSFDKTPQVEGLLSGIKGQYLILDSGVINLRKFTSYEIEFTPGVNRGAAATQLHLL
jgi:Protein of unknown function (DUF2797)